MTPQTKRILALSLPIIGGMMSQNIINLVDTLMIGQLGSLALAGCAIGSFIFYLSFVAFIGVSSGVQTMVARLTGASKLSHRSIPLMLGLAIALLGSLGIVLPVLGTATRIASFFSSDPITVAVGNDYLRYRILGLPFFAMSLVIRGFWNGVGTPMRYLKIIIGVHLMNICLNYALIFGHFGAPTMGAAGAGLASTISLFFGIALLTIDIRSHISIPRSKTTIKRYIQWMLALSAPISIQQFIEATGVVCFFWILGQLGSNALAIGHVLVNIGLVALLPGIGLGLATMTLVSESIGRHDVDSARYWPTQVHRVGKIIIGFFSIVALVVPMLLLRPFITDLSLLSMAKWPMQLDAIALFFEVGAIIYMHALNGADQTARVAMASCILQWLILLPLTYVVGVKAGLGIHAIWELGVAFQVIQFLIFKGLWKRYSRRLKQLPIHP
jgi:putative MATE family efflux protein